MFSEGDYDKPEFSIPVNGMNQFVSPDALPSNFCYSLENIIPAPLGVGKVRYGTGFKYSLENIYDSIFRAFPFTLNDYTYPFTIKINQLLMYISYYLQDSALVAPTINSSSQITFNSANPYYYQKDTKVRIVYTLNNIIYTIYSEIKNSLVLGGGVTIVFDKNLLPSPTAGIVINEIWSQRGKIYVYNVTDNVLITNLKDNLEIACIPRCTYYKQKMLIFNGINNVMEWDGTNLNDVIENVTETNVNNFNRINANNFSFNLLPSFDESKYLIGKSIILKVNGIETNLTIQNKVKAGNLVTLTTNEILPVFINADRVVLYYQDKPPAFSYMYVAKDRIWALGPGVAGLEFRKTDEQMKVYYNYQVNPGSGYGFFNEATKNVPYINMSEKTQMPDNFEAITQVNGMMAFIGRNHTQVWVGYTPGQGGDFSWSANLSEGIFHGDLLLEISNDVFFVSENGLKSFGTLNVAKQFSATPSNAVDPIIKKFIFDAKYSNLNYRKCTAFKYEDGGFCGFKIAENRIVSSLFENKLYSWFFLSGDFSVANCFTQLDKLFYIFIGNKIFKYADGNDGSARIYGDQDGKSFISISWIPGLVSFKGRKGYANKRYELIMDYQSSFVLNDKNLIQVSIFGDIPRSFELTDKCRFEYRGDLLEQEPLSKEESNTKPGFRLRKEYQVINKRLKFESSSFWISVSGYVMNGPVTIRKIRLFGVGEK